MTFTRMLRDAAMRVSLMACMATVNACGTPPSVGPLLKVADRALREEAALQEVDLERDVQQVAQVRQSLTAAFEKDLVQTPELSADWVRDAVDVYTAAREELVRHEAALRSAGPSVRTTCAPPARRCSAPCGCWKSRMP